MFYIPFVRGNIYFPPTLRQRCVQIKWLWTVLLPVPGVWWVFNSQWMSSFVFVCLCRVEVCTGTIAGGRSAVGRPRLNFKSDFPTLAGQDVFFLGWEGTALSLLEAAPPFRFFPSWELLSPSVTARKHPGKPKSPSTPGLPEPAAHTETPNEWGSGGRREPPGEPPRQCEGWSDSSQLFLGSSVYLAILGCDLSLHCITSQQIAFCQAL